MVVKAGGFRTRLYFERQSTTKDGVGQLQNTWTAICNRVCAVEDLNGREYFNASGEKSEVTTRVRVRYDTTVAVLKAYDRAVDYSTSPGTVYDIISPPINPNRRNQEIILMVKRTG